MDDDVHQGSGGRSTTVTGTAANAQAAANSETMTVTGASLMLTDDDKKGFAFTPAEFVEVTEGGAPAAYTVALTSEPVGDVGDVGDAVVTVEVAAEGNAFLSVSPSSLTFTAGDLGHGADGDGDGAGTTGTTWRSRVESSSLSHKARGGGYGSVSEPLPVSVEGDTKVRTSGASGTTTYIIEGRQVKVTVEAGVLEGIVVDFAGVRSAAAGPVPAMRISPDVPEEIIARAVGDGFNLGPEGSRTVVALEVMDAPGVRVCLPVNAEVDTTRDGIAARLRLIHYDEDKKVWAPDDEAMYEAAMKRMCVSGVTPSSPFATGYTDTKPGFPPRGEAGAGVHGGRGEIGDPAGGDGRRRRPELHHRDHREAPAGRAGLGGR